MFPGDMQAVMAKILFFIFAFIMLCFSRVHSASAQSTQVQVQKVSLQQQQGNQAVQQLLLGR